MGNGHNGAANELERRLVAAGWQVEIRDWLTANPWLGQRIESSYRAQLDSATWAYDLLYVISSGLNAPIEAATGAGFGRQVAGWIRESRPDIVLSTYPLASGTLSWLRRRGRISVPTATFVTDFAGHASWAHPGIDLHLAIHPVTAARLNRLVPTSRCVAPGPVVPPRFHSHPSKAEARRILGLELDEVVPLVVAGAWGVGRLDRTVDELLASGLRPLLVCGKNDELHARMRRIIGSRALAWRDDMETLMAASDVLIENAGGLTSLEAFAAGLPVLSFLPIAGHGRWNAALMNRAGVAMLSRPGRLGRDVQRLTGRVGEDQAARAALMFHGDPVDELTRLAR
jgi:UDP-N-acetylglucosamine:LPS N-acetylglucosamine transferase